MPAPGHDSGGAGRAGGPVLLLHLDDRTRPAATAPARSRQRAGRCVEGTAGRDSPSMIAGSDERAPALPPACAFPPAGDDITMARHRELAGRFIGHVTSGDTYAAGAWLRRRARDPRREPLAAAGSAHHRTARCTRPECAPVRGELGARDIRRQHRAGAGWLTAIGEIIMCGTIGTARQASAGGHARHTAAADRAAPGRRRRPPARQRGADSAAGRSAGQRRDRPLAAAELP